MELWKEAAVDEEAKDYYREKSLDQVSRTCLLGSKKNYHRGDQEMMVDQHWTAIAIKDCARESF